MMRHVWMLTIVLVGGLFDSVARGQSPEEANFFEAKVRPLLHQHCFSCHSGQPKKQKGGLAMDSRANLLKGGESGPALVPGDAAKSLLMKAVHYNEESLQMPPRGKLADREVAILEEWVRRGAFYPAGRAGGVNSPATASTEAGTKFWSLQPLKRTPPPTTNKKDWGQRGIDAYVLAAMEKQGLQPTAPASRRTLVRRATFDVIGLPPTPAEVEAFEKDERPDAYARLVDRLLDSPKYGERWGRFWLDLSRYCDIAEQWSESQGKAYHYRDWVVKAFNDDVPYNQFVMKQLAADHMPDATVADRAALGFLGLSPTYWKELNLAPDTIRTVVGEEWEERIQAVTSTFLGLTVACARCHDHKFDPITMQDYYALAGIVNSTRLADRPLIPDAEASKAMEARTKVKKLEEQLKKMKEGKKSSKDELAKIENEIAAVRKSTPNFDLPLVPGVQDAALVVLADGPHRTKLDYKMGEAQNVAMQIRGNPANLGAVVPRRFLSVFAGKEPRTFQQGSGRLELARSIVEDASALTSRVIVNRVWRYHFGRGLVETPSDFGTQGDRPTHPELLDDLAARFIENGWSFKWLHREIMLSATYRQGSIGQPKQHQADPENRWLARMSRRRLEVEAWRDAMLAVTGTLQETIGGPPGDLSDLKNGRRTLYGSVKRRELNDMLRLHDFPDPIGHSPNRIPTTTPLQQLFTLNSPLVQHLSKSLVRRLETEVKGTDADRIRRAYLLLYARPATERQVQWALEFLAAGQPRDVAWQQYAQILLGSNEFLFVD